MTPDERRRALAYLGVEPSAQERWLQSQMDAAAADGEILVYGPIVPEDEAAFSREIWGDESVVSAVSFRAALNAISGPALVRINSPGGVAWEAAAIHGAIVERRNRGADVRCCVDGLAASAAAVVMVGGSRILCSALGSVMLHRAQALTYGHAGDMRAMADMLDGLDRSNAALFAPRLGMSADGVIEEIADERWYTAEEAVTAGLVDEIITAGDDGGGGADADADILTSRTVRLAALFGAGSHRSPDAL